MLSHYNNEHGKGEQAQKQVHIKTTDGEVELEPMAEDVQITSEEPPVKSYSPVKAPEINEVITYVDYLGFQEICALLAEVLCRTPFCTMLSCSWFICLY